MAVSEGQSSLLSWKKSFVTAIRQNENACQDIFQNSEKLLASAVSICRLKGSVECQTGGLITVCEELQSLVRLAFSEVKRVEKDLRSQNTKLEKEIFNLIEKVKHLEEEKRDSKLLNNEVTHTAEQRTSEPLRNGRNRKSKEAIANKIPCHSSLTHSETSIPDDDSDSYMFNADYAENTVVVSVENAQISKDQTVSICPKESKKWNSRKRLKKLTSESDHEISSPAEVGDSNLEGLPSCTKENEEKQHSQKPTSVGKKSNTVIEEKPPLEEKQKRHPEGNSEVQSERATKGTKCTRRSTLRKKKADCNKQETEEFMGDKKSDAWNSKEKLEQKEVFKEAKKTKTRKTESLQNELLSQDDTNLVEDIPETMKSHERNKSTVDNKESKDFSVKESMDVKMKVVSLEGDSQDHKPEFKARKRLSCNKNSKLSHECIIKINKMSMEEGNEELKIALTQNSQLRGKSVEDEISGISDESAAMDDHDEPLGDMSFLIDVNSKISLFVSDAAQEECELDPMTARERNEVYKVAQIYKLRARIGTKAANNLATVRLSKQADTKMPKPGQVDRLLSELSIAASKEALKDSPKSHIKKRKYGIEVDKNKNGNDSDQSGPPKKKFAKKFRSNKD